MATKDGDTLNELSLLVTLRDVDGIFNLFPTEKDWPCIWPIPNDELWENYPTAKACAKADVSNLVMKSGPEFRLNEYVHYHPDLPENDDRNINFYQHLVNVEEFFSPTSSFSSGTIAATYISVVANDGATPIKQLIVAGHCGPGGNIGGFTVDSLLEVVAPGINGFGHNVYENAIHQVGPPRCWFTRNSEVYGAACWSGIPGNGSNAWADDFARKTLRGPAIAFGSPSRLHIVPHIHLDNNGVDSVIKVAKFGFEGQPLGDPYYNVPELLKADEWILFRGVD